MKLKKLYTYKDKFEKVEKVKEKPTLKQVKQRTANILVYGLVGLFALVGFLGSLRAIALSSQVSSLKNQVMAFEKVVDEVPVNQKDIDVSKARQYMVDFMKIYINYSDETASERLTALEDYYSFSMSDSKDTIKESRVLTGQNLIGLKQEEDFYVADMKVSYETHENGQQVTKLSVLSIPFRTDNGLFSIISPPYFKREDVLLGESKALERKKTEDVERLDESVDKSIRDFLPIFFEKYALSNETDLALLMKNPYFMGGQYTVQEIVDSSTLIYKEDEKTVVQLSVVFLDRAGASHTENFTLYLVEQDSGWFVEELYHYFKG